MVEYILCNSGPAEHWGPLPATRLASRKILIEQNIKKRMGPALCVFCVCTVQTVGVLNVHLDLTCDGLVDPVVPGIAVGLAPLVNHLCRLELYIYAFNFFSTYFVIKPALVLK
jgi:hypothetical protein